MILPGWIEGFPGAITVCDPQGIILYMNDTAAQNFVKDGGRALIGQDVLACHPEPSRTLLAGMLTTQQPHVYTIEKNGVKKLVYQTPWYEAGSYRGFVEVLISLPADMPHFVRG
jgi:transcriptional regulator with PAS, ATPase and Fis domain